jgi:hypothetical protein
MYWTIMEARPAVQIRFQFMYCGFKLGGTDHRPSRTVPVRSVEYPDTLSLIHNPLNVIISVSGT